MKRRDILKNIGLGTVGVAVSTDVLAQTKPKTNPPTPVVANGRLKHEIEHDKALNSKKFFNLHELATITILCDIIIPADSKSGSASQAGVPAFIEFIVKDIPSHQTPLRGGLMWLDSESKRKFGKPFKNLLPKDRIEMVDLIAYPNKAKPEHSQGVSFFNLMRNLTATGFFTSEIGVKDLDYKGNTPNKWDGVPEEVLKQYNLSYQEWEKHASK